MANRVGQKLGNYSLIKLLGEGSFAEVYLGHHQYLEKSAAIKVLQEQLTIEDSEPFRIEARTISRLEHQHIVRVLEFGIEERVPYLVMSYAPNGTLRTRHPKGTRLLLGTIVGYVQQIAAALQYAHNQNLIHRDIKPENILLGEHNEILLSDFGLATIASRTSSRSLRDTAGTPLYMAPEQFKGKPCLASDQYALGVMVYEWLSGIPPFYEGNAIQLGYQHTHEAPPSLRGSLSTVPLAVEQVVLKALAKDPKERWPSIQEFATALAQASKTSSPQGNRSGSQPGPYPIKGPSIGRGTKFPTIILIGLAFIIVAGSTLFYTLRGNSTGASSLPTNLPHSTRTVPVLNTGASPGTTQVSITATTPSDAQAIATLDASTTNPYGSHKGTVALNSSFSTAVGVWDQSSSCQFTNKAYYVTTVRGYTQCRYNSGSYSNFAFQVQVEFVTTNICGGIFFRDQVPSYFAQYYEFYICTDGTYQLATVAPLFTSLRSGSSLFNMNVGQSNVIAVVANGSQFDLYINGQQVNSVSDRSFSTGEIGVLASYLTNANAANQVAFNDARVWTL